MLLGLGTAILLGGIGVMAGYHGYIRDMNAARASQKNLGVLNEKLMDLFLSLPTEIPSDTAKISPPTQATPSKPAPTMQARTKETLLSISGSGTKSTKKFTVVGEWDLNWSYHCSDSGMNGIFQVYIYDNYGNPSFSNGLINQSGASGSDTQYYHNPGTYYLEVNSMCSWTIEVKG